MNAKVFDEGVKSVKEIYGSVVGKPEEVVKSFQAKACEEYLVYVTCKSYPKREKHCITISGKDGDPTMKDVIVASRRAFNNVHLNEVTDWTGYVLPSSVQLSRMHTDGVIHHIIIRCNPKLLDQPVDNTPWATVGLVGAGLTAVAAGWWYHQRQQTKADCDAN
jgi:hypothetical protein